MEYVFDLSGGRLCLDFANTLDGRASEPRERLNTYADLVSWGRQAGSVSPSAARRPASASMPLVMTTHFARRTAFSFT